MKKLLLSIALLFLGCGLSPTGTDGSGDEPARVDVHVVWEEPEKATDLFVYEDGRILAVVVRSDYRKVERTVSCADGARLHAEYKNTASDVLRTSDTVASAGMTWYIPERGR